MQTLTSESSSSKRGRVLLLSDVTGHGGTTKYLYQQALAARAAGWKCEVLLDDGSNTDIVARALHVSGAGLIRRPLYHGRHTEMEITGSVRSVLKSFEPDIVHITCGSVRSCIKPSEVILDEGIPLVITEQYVSRLTNVSEEHLARLQRIHSQAFAIIVVSHENRVLLSRYWGLEPLHITVIPNAVDLPKQFPKPRTVPPRRIVTVTRLTHQKGVDTLLRAMCHLKNSEIDLDVIGDGELREELEHLSRTLGLDRVTFLGWKDGADQGLQQYDLFVLPSRAEGQPFALIEALVEGLPCIATRVSGNPEVLGDGQYGDLISPDNPEELGGAISDFLKRPERLRRMSAASESFIWTNHSIHINMERVLAIWDAAVRDDGMADLAPTKAAVLRPLAIQPRQRPRLLVAVVSTNDGRWLAPCFAALAKSRCLDFDLLLIDNQSDDDTASAVAAAPLPVRSFSVRGRMSFAEANNLAFRSSLSLGYRYVMLLNPDTRVHHDALRVLIDFMDSNNDFGAAGSWQARYGDETWSQPNDWTVQVLDGSQVPAHSGARRGAFTVFECDYVQGAAILVRTGLLKQIGLLDSVYGTFYEETDLCRRCRLRGYRVGLLLESRVQHQGGGHWRQSTEANRWRDHLYLRNQLLYKLSEPGVSNWPFKCAWEIMSDQVNSIRNHKEELVIPLRQYHRVLVDTLRHLRYIKDLRIRNRLILDKDDVPESLSSVGPASLRASGEDADVSWGANQGHTNID